MLVRRIILPDRLPAGAAGSWPFSMPCVAALADGLELTKPVTFLVGENGSDKSTLVEAIAEAFGLDARGGRAGRKYAMTGRRRRSARCSGST
jgi:predicted ATPase